MRNSRDVKDKSITLEHFQFRAHVAYYDGRVVDCGLHATLPAAQKVLARFPRDVWDGYDKDDFRYKEPDRYVRRNTQNVKTTRRKSNPMQIFGRTFGKPVPGQD